MKKLFSGLESITRPRTDKPHFTRERRGDAGKNIHNIGTKPYLAMPKSPSYNYAPETLLKLVERGDVKGAELAIKAGADVNRPGMYGYTPLFYAAEKGHSDCVELLVKSGADVNCTAKYGTTPLMRAARNGCDKCVELLIKAGADVNAVEITTSTALLEASKAKSVRSVQLLLKAGAEVNRANEVHLEFLNDRINKRSPAMKKIAMLLFTAGQILEGVTVTWFGEDFFRSRNEDEYCTLKGKTITFEWCKSEPKSDSLETLEDIDQIELNLGLRHKCREVIRKEITTMNPNANLFKTIPKLGLPSVINYYLLYYVPLED